MSNGKENSSQGQLDQNSLDKSESGEESKDGEQNNVQAYRMRPKLEDQFKPSSAKEIINSVLADYLSKKEYKHDEAKVWAKEISEIIKEKIKELKFNNYKFCVVVTIGEKNGAGVKSATRCVWDAETDCYTHENFVNDTIFCVAAVYALYTY